MNGKLEPSETQRFRELSMVAAVSVWSIATETAIVTEPGSSMAHAIGRYYPDAHEYLSRAENGVAADRARVLESMLRQRYR